MWKVTPGTTSYRGFRVRILDASTGAPYTGATSATSGASFGYTRPGSTRTSISLSDLAAVDSAYSSGGMKHIGSGWYRLDLPDAAIAAGVDGVLIDGAFTSYVVVAPPVLLETTQTGDSYARIGAAGAGLTAVGDTAGTTTLLSRLTSTRAGYLDNLSAGAVATAAKLLSYFQSALRKDVTVDSDIGGNYDDATDSQEAIRDRGDSAWGASGVATTVWEYSTRTLTQGAASVTAAVTGTSITAYRGTRWSITLTGLTTFSDTTYTSIIFSVKRNTDDADSKAICQVRKNRTGGGDGLTAFEGAPTVTAGQASITVNSATSITIVVEGATTQYATPDDYVYGIKVLDASGYPSMISSGGKFTVSADVPMLVS